jgi:hypothetical protein
MFAGELIYIASTSISGVHTAGAGSAGYSQLNLSFHGDEQIINS